MKQFDFLKAFGDKSLVAAPFDEAKARLDYLDAIKKEMSDASSDEATATKSGHVHGKLLVLKHAQHHLAKTIYDDQEKKDAQLAEKLAADKAAYSQKCQDIDAGNATGTSASPTSQSSSISMFCSRSSI
jgi:hypothetical protein